MTTPAPDTALATTALEPEIDHGGLPARRMSVQEIAVARPQAMELFTDAMAAAARNLRKAAFALTDPEDFIGNRDREGNETFMLAAPGAQKIAPLLGLVINNLRGPDGQPVSSPVMQDGRACIVGDVESRVLGSVIEGVLAERGEDEQFTGRSGNKGDLRASAFTLLQTKAVRMMLGMTRVPKAVMEANGIDLARCRKGHGYGTSAERHSGQSAAPDAKAGAVSTTIFGVASRSGTAKSGKPWNLFMVQTKDGDFGTFSTDIADSARQAIGRLAVIEFKPTPKGGRDIVSIVAEDAPEPAF